MVGTAHTAFTKAEQSGALDADELELLASAATFSAKPDDETAAHQRAFSLVRTDEPRRGARLAILLSMTHIARDSMAVGIGWAQRAKELLEDQGECEEAVTFSLLEVLVASETRQKDRALIWPMTSSSEPGDSAPTTRRHWPPSLKGGILVGQGRIDEGAPSWTRRWPSP